MKIGRSPENVTMTIELSAEERKALVAEFDKIQAAFGYESRMNVPLTYEILRANESGSF